MASQSDKKAIFSEINITPLTDIFLVLLIIMMVVAPTFQSVDNTIEIPEINSGVAIEQKEATVSITADGTYYLNGEKITADDLYTKLEQLQPELEKKEVVVKADTSVKSSYIMEVMRAAENAQYQKLTIAGEPLSKKDSKLLEEAQGLEDNTDNEISEPNPEYNNEKQPIGAIPGDE